MFQEATGQNISNFWQDHLEGSELVVASTNAILGSLLLSLP